MTGEDYLKALREKWVVWASFLLLGIIIAAVSLILTPPTYAASSTLYVSTQSDNTTQAYQGSLLSEQRVQSYTELLTGPRVTGSVVQRLQLATLPDDLAQQMTASAAPDTVLLTLTSTDHDAQVATNITNTATAVFTDLVNELERPVNNAGAPVVAVRVVQPAAPPVEPIGPSAARYLILGVVGGALVGLAGALLANAMDTSIKSSREAERITKAPTLASVAEEKDDSNLRLPYQNTPRSGNAEAFKRLRTNLYYVRVDSPSKVLLVTSSLPGEGKSTVSANLAKAFVDSGASVLLIDCDLRRPQVANLFGLEGSVGLSSVLAQRVGVREALQRTRFPNLSVLVSGPSVPNPSELLGSDRMSALLQDLGEKYDVVLLDAAPLLPVADSVALAPKCDAVIMLLSYGRTRIAQLTDAVETLGRVGAPVIGNIINRIPRRDVPEYYAYSHSNSHRDTAVRTPLTTDAENSYEEESPNTVKIQREAQHPTPRPRR